MARAYYACASCSEDVQVVAKNRREADRLAKWHDNHSLCQECKSKELAEESAKHAQASRDYGLPELIGSEKQVTWAETLRYHRINEIDELIELGKKQLENESMTDEQREKLNAQYGDALRAFAWVEDQQQASWWIDTRHKTAKGIILDAVRVLRKLPPPDLREQELRAESTIIPENCDKSSVVAEIVQGIGSMSVYYPKLDEELRKLLKYEFGFEWRSTHWEKRLGAKDECPNDRLAEIGNKVLNLGIPVLIWDEEIRANAVSGNYKPLHPRWIVWLVESKRFGIWWKRPDDFYSAAKKLPAAKWSKPYVVLPVESAEEVLAFAECHDFKISPVARDVIDSHIAAKHQAVITEVSAPKKTAAASLSRPVLDTAEQFGVDADLLDD